MPRSKEAFKQITDQRRQSIFDAALKLFAMKGYDSVSVDDITKASKCSHGLFYHYFSSKADLFTILMKNIQSIWEEATKNFDANKDPLLILKEATDFYLELLDGDDYNAYILYLFLTFHLQRNLPEYPKVTYRNPDRKFNTIPEVVKAGMEEGVFEPGDPQQYVRAYFACLEGLAYNRISLGKNRFVSVPPEVLYNIFLKKA